MQENAPRRLDTMTLFAGTDISAAIHNQGAVITPGSGWPGDW